MLEGAAMTRPILRAIELAKHYPIERSFLGRPTRWLRAVDGVSFEVGSGETLSLVGESGCGKSTTGRMLVRLIEPTSGQVEFEGHRVDRGAAAPRQISRKIQFIFQDPYASLNPRMSVGETIAEPLRLHRLRPKQQYKLRVGELLDMVGLPAAFAGRYPHQLSGGQRQRVGIARALAAEPSFIVCDEAVSALDVSVQAQVLNLLKALKVRLGLSLLFIAHDLAVVKHISDRVAVMYLGRFVEVAPVAELFSAPRHPYTRALLASIPRPGFGHQRSAAIQGDVPSPIDPPSGCRFHTRCPLKTDVCEKLSPPLETIGSAHSVACHRWRDVRPMPATQPVADETSSARIRRLLASFGDAASANPQPQESCP
jgi:peptide/nickel transport system ATP-binding protein/oligopeptide transport system ATP-binding protein